MLTAPLILAALLANAPATDPALDDLAQLDQTISALAAMPPSVGRLGVLRGLAAAEDRLQTRALKVSELLPGTAAPNPPVGVAEVRTRLASAAQALVIVFVSEGPALGIREAVLARLTALGYRTRDAAGKDVDVRLTVTHELDEPWSDGALHHVKASITFVLEDAQRGKPIGQFKEMYRYGGDTEEVARQRAIEELAKRVDEKAIDRLDRMLKGRPMQKPAAPP